MKHENIDLPLNAEAPLTAQPTQAKDILQKRHDDLLEWISENAPQCSEQRHLDEGTTERAYWHYGYLMALADMLALFGSASMSRH